MKKFLGGILALLVIGLGTILFGQTPTVTPSGAFVVVITEPLSTLGASPLQVAGYAAALQSGVGFDHIDVWAWAHQADNTIGPGTFLGRVYQRGGLLGYFIVRAPIHRGAYWIVAYAVTIDGQMVQAAVPVTVYDNLPNGVPDVQ